MKKLIDRFKEFNNNTYGMLITTCWCLLIVCLVIKLFGGNWFELMSTNEKFNSFCNYVESTMWLKMIIACIIYLISGYFIISTILNKKMKTKEFIIFYPLMILKSILNWYLPIISFILDLFILLGLTTILNHKFKRNIICYIMIFALQFITIIFRNLSYGIGQFNFGNNFIEQLLIQIDYYIMIILWFLYTFKRKEEK